MHDRVTHVFIFRPANKINRYFFIYFQYQGYPLFNGITFGLPNGRWGDNRFSDYGDLQDYHLFTVSLGSKKNKLKMWKEELNSIDDVKEVFTDFLDGKIKYLSWCDSVVSETLSIKFNQSCSVVPPLHNSKNRRRLWSPQMSR